VNEAHAARLAHLGLDAVLGLELVQKLVGRERDGKDIRLALHGREITGAQLLQSGQALLPLACQAGGMNLILKVKRRSAAWSSRSSRLVVQTKMPSKRSMPCSISLTSVTS
jgi:hypothetical protein